MVSRPDRRDILSYLDGESDTSPCVDKNAPLEIAMQRPQPYVKAASSLASGSGISSSSISITSNKRSALSLDDKDHSDTDPSTGSKILKSNFMSDVSGASGAGTDQANSDGQLSQTAALNQQLIGRIAKNSMKQPPYPAVQ